MSLEEGYPTKDSDLHLQVTASCDQDGCSDDNYHDSQKGTASQMLQHASLISPSGHTNSSNQKLRRQAGLNKQGKSQNDSVSQGPEVRETPGSQPSPKDNSPKDIASSTSSRIHRGTGLRKAANVSLQKGTRYTPDLRSSIPIAVHRRSSEQLCSGLLGNQTEPSSSGIRVIEKPRGPRPRPSAEQTGLVISEPLQGTEDTYNSANSTASSSSISSWGLDNNDEPEKPATVFTGEYRTRVLTIPGHPIPCPTLRIASSAENIIMGEASCESPNCAVTQSKSSARIKYLDKIIPSTPKAADSPKGTPSATRETPETKNSVSGSQESTPAARNFCRPQISLDSIQRRDLSNKEMLISRKPVSKPSLSSLVSPSSMSLQSENEPLVPKIPDQYCSGQENGMWRVASRATEPEIPTKGTPKPKDTPSKLEVTGDAIPDTVIKAGNMQPHPPRTSSLQALSHSSDHAGPQQSLAAVNEVPFNVASTLKRNVTFNDFVPLSSNKEHVTLSGDRTRIPGSRSNNILGTFRNIFKSRSGTTEKERAKTDEGDSLEPVNENHATNGDQGSINALPKYSDIERNVKVKPKHTTLSSGVSWTRSPKVADESPATPNPSLPRLLEPPNRLPEGNIPSFARPTKSTRTKASFGLKSPAPITSDIHPRRAHVRTASTGSPQRLNHGSRRTTGGLLVLPTHKRANQTPSFVDEKTAGASASAESTNCVPKNLDAVHACLETLCRKVGEAATQSERARHIRLALNLQQQLGNYQGIEKMALEAETLVNEKRWERKVAEEALRTSLAEIQHQLDEV